MQAPERAQPPRIPPTTRTLERADAAHKTELSNREALERHSIVRALLILALVVLAASFVRAGFALVFVHRWWHP